MQITNRLGNVEATVGEKLCSALLQWAGSRKFAPRFSQPGRTDRLLDYKHKNSPTLAPKFPSQVVLNQPQFIIMGDDVSLDLIMSL